ncbi:hypothetical protein [Rhodocyclus tenuis]|uniref:hypothetical protein n=1 Tax=Rhodocyclus tenuis TaxID=1066 RepID=UPI00190433A9|nr:hypothetical protein [Rhodocyclus tenuis]MBK1678798.1 hypothetical protein [Rhodocyclus tenuis]
MPERGNYDIPALREKMHEHLAENADAYPLQLEQRFPQILARLVELWGTADLDHYLNSLMVADRSDRQGFPSDAAREIFRLSVIHGALGLAAKPSGTGWMGVGDLEIDRYFEKKHGV